MYRTRWIRHQFANVSELVPRFASPADAPTPAVAAIAAPGRASPLSPGEPSLLVETFEPHPLTDSYPHPSLAYRAALSLADEAQRASAARFRMETR